MTAPLLAAAPNTLRRRSRISAAAELVADSVVGLVNIPGMQASAKVVQDMTVALKPNVFQAPARNDASAQAHIDSIVEVLASIESSKTADRTAEESGALFDDLVDSGLEEVQSLVDDLNRVKAGLTAMKSEKYTTKLTYQKDIDGLLLGCMEEVSRRITAFLIGGSMRANQVASRSLELEHRVEALTASLASSEAKVAGLESHTAVLNTLVAESSKNDKLMGRGVLRERKYDLM